MKAIDSPFIIDLKRTQYGIRNKPNRWQRIASRFCEAVALAAVAMTFAAVAISAATPGLLPIPA